MILLLSRITKIILSIVVFTLFFYLWKPAPEFMTKQDSGVMVPESSVRFLADYTFIDESGERRVEQYIWDEVFSMIDRAEEYILMDVFLFNPYQGKNPQETRLIGKELTERLIKKKTEGHIAIVVITDPINGVYGGDTPTYIDQLRNAGIYVIETDLEELPDSNRLWSSIWRPFFSWGGNSTHGGWLSHPFDVNGKQVTLRTWLTLVNFKANHRKLIVADEPQKGGGSKMVTLVTSSNPHDASSAHGNVAIQVSDKLWKSVIRSEGAVAALGDDAIPTNVGTDANDLTGDLSVKLLTEKSIRVNATEILKNTQKDETVDIVMFYLSDREVVREMVAAAVRGAKLRIILDPNKDAFGWEKNGIPNRPVAKELISKGKGNISIRWCDTHGEQCHAKLMMGKNASSTYLMIGSANFTRRNIGGFNLEASVLAEREKEFTAWKDANAYFERLWTNEGGNFTLDYASYRDDTIWKQSLYRVMERTGLSSF
jgi:phosphatidylserine/phosphatidylglycerophosphate/cardiolipin synthase-like enzyme